MKIDTGVGADLSRIPEAARRADEAGFDAMWAAETAHDPFIGLAIAAEHTERVALGTSIAVAFARNPMSLAYTTNDIHRLSEGRMILGLGSQIRPHIEKRFSMPWSKPVERMREMILAMRAIWSAWNEETRLDFRGEFYTHTLMTPFFAPPPNPHGQPKVYLAGVGPRMTEVAGEVADGFLAHGFSTPKFFREVTIPAIERGLRKAGKSRDDFEITCPGFMVIGSDEKERIRAAEGVRRQIAFYGSTPAYRPVLEMHGWGELQTQLNTMSKRGEWADMGKLIDDEMLETFAIVAKPEDVPKEVEARYGGLATRIRFGRGRDSSGQSIVSELRAL